MSSSTWPAPYAAAAVVAQVRVPGSKSVTNRALLLAALADGRSTLRCPLRSRDTALMADALRALGARIDDASDGSWTVDGGRFTGEPARIDVGNAGTVLRFLPAVAPLTTATVAFDGDAAAHRRPVGPLLDALRQLGATIDDDGRGSLPFVVRGVGTMAGGPVELDASSSSQLVSALLLAGARYAAGVEVCHVGDRAVPNAPHLAMTVGMLRDRGVDVSAEPSRWRVRAGSVAARDQVVEPDLSSAAPFLAAAVVTGGEVSILDWPAHSAQPGALLPHLLERFGARWHREAGRLVVSGGEVVTGADLDLRDAGELTPVLAAVAAVAASPSRFVGVEYLRGHETDRLAALASELTRLGAGVRELDDGLEIVPKPLRGAVLATYDDHRLAMAAAVLGLVVPGVEIEDIAATGKTFPGFATAWREAVEGPGATR